MYAPSKPTIATGFDPPQLIDNHGRVITYLRLAITDRCNLRCSYCMPEDGVETVSHGETLSYEELEPYYTKVDWEIGVSGAPGPFDPPRSKPYPVPPMPLKSMSSIRKPTDGFGAPWYCSSSPAPRIWK